MPTYDAAHPYRSYLGAPWTDAGLTGEQWLHTYLTDPDNPLFDVFRDYSGVSHPNDRLANEIRNEIIGGALHPAYNTFHDPDVAAFVNQEIHNNSLQDHDSLLGDNFFQALGILGLAAGGVAATGGLAAEGGALGAGGLGAEAIAAPLPATLPEGAFAAIGASELGSTGTGLAAGGLGVGEVGGGAGLAAGGLGATELGAGGVGLGALGPAAEFAAAGGSAAPSLSAGLLPASLEAGSGSLSLSTLGKLASGGSTLAGLVGGLTGGADATVTHAQDVAFTPEARAALERDLTYMLGVTRQQQGLNTGVLDVLSGQTPLYSSTLAQPTRQTAERVRNTVQTAGAQRGLTPRTLARTDAMLGAQTPALLSPLASTARGIAGNSTSLVDPRLTGYLKPDVVSTTSTNPSALQTATQILSTAGAVARALG